LKSHERSKDYFKDKGFCAKLEEIRQDDTEEGAKKLKEYMFLPRIMQCIGILTDIGMPDTSAGRAETKELLMISSDEEEYESSDDSSDEESAPWIRPKTKKEKEQKAKAKVLSKTKAKSGGSGGAKKKTVADLTEAEKEEKRKGIQERLAKSMGVSVSTLNTMLKQTHGKDAGGGSGGGGAAGEGAAGAFPEFVELGEGEEIPAEEVVPADKDVEKAMAAMADATEEEKAAATAMAAGGAGGAMASAGGNVSLVDKLRASRAKRAAASATATKGGGSGGGDQAAAIIAADVEVELPPLVMPETEEERKAMSLKVKVEAGAVYQTKKFKHALQLYNRCLELDPTNIVFHMNIGAVHLVTQDYDACVAACDTAIAVGTKNEADPKLIAKAYARAGRAQGSRKPATSKDYAAARDAYKMALELDRKKEYLEAKTLHEKNRKAAVDTEYEDPLKAQGAKARGNDFYKNGKYADAIREYTDALRRDPNNFAVTSRIYSNRAACFSNLGENVRCIQDCDHCIEADPKWSKGYLRKGTLLNKLSQYEEAVAVFKAALVADPHSFEGRTGLAKAEEGLERERLALRGKADKAFDDLKTREIWEASRALLLEMQENPDSWEVKKQLMDPQIQKNLQHLRKVGLLG